LKYLLDSMVWLWSIGSVEKINKPGRAIFDSGDSEIYLSAATAWELTIKARLGKLALPSPPAKCIAEFMAKQRLLPLSITHLHAVKVYDLALHHNDPFDRMLIAQSIVEEMIILTSDRIFRRYPAEILWCGP
jgi:PIN domain nuclease of toxin-antitoxin system